MDNDIYVTQSLRTNSCRNHELILKVFSEDQHGEGDLKTGWMRKHTMGWQSSVTLFLINTINF